MSAPAPGKIPIAVPIRLERTQAPGRVRKYPIAGRRIGAPATEAASPAFVPTEGVPTQTAAPRKTSDKPNSPIIAGMKLIPWNSSGWPNVNRA